MKNMDYPTNAAAGSVAQKQPVRILRSAHYVEVAPYRVLRAKGIAEWHLTYTIHGRGHYRQPEVEFESLPGDLVLFEPGAYQDYGCGAQSSWEFIWVHFMAKAQWLDHLLGLPLAGKKLHRSRFASAGIRHRVRDALLRCHKESCIGTDSLSGDFTLHALQEVILLAARENPATTLAPPLSPAVRSVIDHMVEKLDQRHTLGSLAKMVRMSPSHLAYRFKLEIGEAAIAYLLKLRLRQAALMLEDPERRVKDVAEAVGMHDQFYFSRQFSRLFLMSPREYKEKAAAK
jgi:AraC family transcriptional regulator, arabinose operon regulatory protein